MTRPLWKSPWFWSGDLAGKTCSYLAWGFVGVIIMRYIIMIEVFIAGHKFNCDGSNVHRVPKRGLELALGHAG